MPELNIEILENVFDILPRWRAGESLYYIAREYSVDQGTVRKWIQDNTTQADYEKYKLEAEKNRKSARVQRQIGLETKSDKLIEAKLETIEPETLEIDDLKVLAHISKLMSDKVNLSEGRATEAIEHMGAIAMLDPEAAKEMYRKRLERLNQAASAELAVAKE